MPKFIASEASLYNGISQQSPELRLPSQVEDAKNANLTLPRGLEVRPPAEVITEEVGLYDNTSLVHGINASSLLSYLVVIAGDGSTLSSKVYDTDGNSYGIFYQDNDARAYLETVDSNGDFKPIEALQLSSVLDFTFACNKNVTPIMDTETKPDLVEEAYMWVKNGVQQVERKLVFNGTTVTHAKQSTNDSNNIINYFVSNTPAGFTSTKISSACMRIVKDDGAAFTLTATDSYSDTTMAAARSDGIKFEDLPPVALDGTVMTIVPEDAADSQFYLEYNADTKSWFEVAAPGETFKFDATTMPHAFIRKTDDALGTITGTPNEVYFSFERLDYLEKTTGNKDSSPDPSFIDTPINDTFFFKNRLGFIAGDNVILSATDDLFRFFPTTVQEVLDDDPIDIAISSINNVTLQHVSPFPESLILIGDTEQFTLGSGGKAFTPENVVLDPTTSYSASPVVPPVSVGSSLYFAAPQSSFAAIREYSVQPDTLVTDAADITAHVPRLIPNTIKQLISENNLEYIFIINNQDYDTEGNELLVYKFYWQGNEKVQSAWIRWNFWFNPLGGTSLDGKLFILGTEKVAGVDNTVLVEVNLSDDPPVVLDDDDTPFKSTRPFIDRLTTTDNTPLEIGDFIILEVTEEQYDYPIIDDATVVVVDRMTGVKYTLISRYTDGGKFYLVLGVPDFLISGDLEFDDTILGSYVLGGEALETLVGFPFTLPLTLS